MQVWQRQKCQGADTDNFYVETVGPMLRKSKIDRSIGRSLCDEDLWALAEFADAPLFDQRLKNDW